MGDINDPGLLSPGQTSLLIDQYELTMAASYHRRRINETAVFELFFRRLPPNRDWLVACGAGPTLRLVEELRFGEPELGFLRKAGFDEEFLAALAKFRFSGEVEGMPEGTLAFADEPVLRVTAPRIEAQVLETLLLNQISFQTMIATKAARLVLAAGSGEPGSGGSVLDFSPRRDHGIDAAMKAARASAIAGCAGTSNVAAAMRFGLDPVGTMAHSYVLSFPTETEAFEAFLQDQPGNAVLLVDTYDTLEGVRNAIAASRRTRVPLLGIRLDSGDLAALSREARRLLDEAGMSETRIVASGDLAEPRIAELVSEGAPIDVWGVGTDLGTSPDSPVVNGVYKLVADHREGAWRGVAKASEGKETRPGAKQVYRRVRDGEIAGDVIGLEEESIDGHPLLVPMMEAGRILQAESIEQMRARTARSLASLPAGLRRGGGRAYRVGYSPGLRESRADAVAG
ncbi:MAG TPA: nicotinate phosphoribosyltransferase [Solirubrobacterales bacterium]|nr:nicotinate phosphoribosyltransferase [Solirubrobacterales bacterium]